MISLRSVERNVFLTFFQFGVIYDSLGNAEPTPALPSPAATPGGKDSAATATGKTRLCWPMERPSWKTFMNRYLRKISR